MDLNGYARIATGNIQWVIETRRAETSSWQPRRYCVGRDVLIRDIGEICGHVDEDVLNEVRKFPNRHPGWDKRVKEAIS